jgi:hypothetical protein
MNHHTDVTLDTLLNSPSFGGAHGSLHQTLQQICYVMGFRDKHGRNPGADDGFKLDADDFMRENAPNKQHAWEAVVLAKELDAHIQEAGQSTKSGRL